MGKKKRFALAISAAVTVILLLAVQISWLVYSYRLEEALFTKSVRIALSQSTATLCSNERFCQSMKQSILCDSSFRASRINTPLLWENINQQIRQDLERYGIEMEYELVIFRGKDTLKINQLDRIIGPSCYRQSMGKALEDLDAEIGVLFPNRFDFFFHRMGLMFLSSILLILMISLAFGLLVRFYLREIQLSQNIKEMVNNLAHEFRTPLSSISLAAKMIQQSPEATTNTKISRYSKTILEENKRLQRETDHILQLAAIEQNSIDYRFVKIDLREIAEEAIRSVEFLISQNGGTLEKKFPNEPLCFWGDSDELTHVFINLLSNAYKYSGDQINILISLHRNQHQIVAEIEDKGIGIAPEEQKRIFEKYYRVSSGNLHDRKGFGLGLYYVKEVLKAHNATIEVKSILRKGSCFTLRFPIQQQEG